MSSPRVGPVRSKNLILVFGLVFGLTAPSAWSESVPMPPILISADAYLLESGEFRLVVDGSDPDCDAVGIRYEAMDAFGQPLTPSIDRVFDFLAQQGGGSFTGAVTVGDLIGLPVNEFLIRIYDAEFLDSVPSTALVVALPVRGLGSACDPLGLRDQCISGTTCTLRGTEFTCQPPLGTRHSTFGAIKALYQ